MALIALPCGRGFCHSQPRSAVWATVDIVVKAKVRAIKTAGKSLTAGTRRKKRFERKVRKGFRKGREGIRLCIPLWDFFALFALKFIGTP
jgi:hypothetical protein